MRKFQLIKRGWSCSLNSISSFWRVSTPPGQVLTLVRRLYTLVCYVRYVRAHQPDCAVISTTVCTRTLHHHPVRSPTSSFLLPTSRFHYHIIRRDWHCCPSRTLEFQKRLLGKEITLEILRRRLRVVDV